MFRLSLSNLSITKLIVLLLAVTTAIVVARVSVADADHHLPAFVTTGTATARYGPAQGYGVVTRLHSQQPLEVMARSTDHQWLLIEAESGVTGWTTANSVQVDGSFDKLAVDNNPLPNAQKYPTAITFQRLVSLRDAPDWNKPVLATLHAGREVIVMAQSPQYEWLYIFDDLGQGWVSRSELVVDFDISTLPVWSQPNGDGSRDSLAIVNPEDASDTTVAGVPEEEIVRGDPSPSSERATASVITAHAAVYSGPGISYNVIGELNERDRPILQARDETGQFVFVWTYRFDGWALASNLNLSINIDSLPVWSRPMQNAQEVATGRVSVANLNVRTEGSVDGDVIGQLLEGQRITIIGRNDAGTWVKHSSALGVGWSYAPLIRLTETIDSLQVTR